MTDSISQRSEGPTPDLLELKVSGSTSLRTDLRRTQEVEVVVRGVVTGHVFEDKRNKNGDVETTIKRAVVKVDELVELSVLQVPRNMAGQTTMGEDGETRDETGAEVVDAELVEDGDAPKQIEGETMDPETGEVGEPSFDPDAGDGEGGAAADESEPAADPDAEEEPPAPDRHPQVPEGEWSELNVAEKREVGGLVAKLEDLAEYLTQTENPTDRKTATDKMAGIHSELKDGFGIKLVPLEELPEEPQPEEGQPPPAPVMADSGPMPVEQLKERRRYISGRTGLPQALAEARDEEIREIDRRLKAQEGEAA